VSLTSGTIYVLPDEHTLIKVSVLIIYRHTFIHHKAKTNKKSSEKNKQFLCQAGLGLAYVNVFARFSFIHSSINQRIDLGGVMSK